MGIGTWINLGKMPYAACAELQKQVMAGVIAGDLPNTLLFVEHDPPVFSLGAGFHEENLLLPIDEYRKRGFVVEPTERGGDVTFHGPNQLVAYPIFHLDLVDRDLHKWLRLLEEAVIVALKTWDIEGYRFPPHTGVWVNGAKICAIGIKVRKWVSMHGIALNVCNDLSPFDLIVPCGIQGYGVTSIERELQHGIEDRIQDSDVKCIERQRLESDNDRSPRDPEGITEGSQGSSEATPLDRRLPRIPTPEGSKIPSPSLEEARTAMASAFAQVFNLSFDQQHREELFARLSERES